jgi:hypothetical protein
MANYTPNGFSDGLFTGRVIAQNFDGSGNALRVDLSNNNALYVEDMRAIYDNSGRLLTYGPSQLMDQSNNYITTTYFNYSGTDFSKNYVQLDVFDVSANYYLKQIAGKNFNVSGTYVYIDKVRIADGSNNFYTSVLYKDGDISYNQLATYDYSANKQLENIYGAVRSYTSTKRIFDPTKNAPPNIYGIPKSTNNGRAPTTTLDTDATNAYNSFSRYLDLTNKSVSSLSFYGTVSQSCILVVQYANPISNEHAKTITNSSEGIPSADGTKYKGTGAQPNGYPQAPYVDYSGSGAVLSTYDVSGWFNTQYNTKITVASTGNPTAFGFNVPFCNAQYVRLMIYKTDGTNPGFDGILNDYTWFRRKEGYNQSINYTIYQYDPDIYASYTWTQAKYQ